MLLSIFIIVKMPEVYLYNFIVYLLNLKIITVEIDVYFSKRCLSKEKKCHSRAGLSAY